MVVIDIKPSQHLTLHDICSNFKKISYIIDSGEGQKMAYFNTQKDLIAKITNDIFDVYWDNDFWNNRLGTFYDKTSQNGINFLKFPLDNGEFIMFSLYGFATISLGKVIVKILDTFEEMRIHELDRLDDQESDNESISE